MKGSTVPPNKFFSAVGLFCILVLNLYLGCCRLLVALECILIDFSLHPKKNVIYMCSHRSLKEIFFLEKEI